MQLFGYKERYKYFFQIKRIDQRLQKILDENNISWESGQHSLSKIKTADFIVKSPGIPSDLPLISLLKSQGKKLFQK